MFIGIASRDCLQNMSTDLDGYHNKDTDELHYYFSSTSLVFE